MKNQHELRIILTPFCNYQCFFCHKEGVMDAKTELLLSPKDYNFIAMVTKRHWGWNTITITGGEPLLSPIYMGTCALLDESGIRITTVTNGSLLANPKQMLMHTKQINVSIHTMNSIVYNKIIGINYPLKALQQTLSNVRLELPRITIHLNVTVVRNYNFSIAEIEKILCFARSVQAQVKLIDLVSEDTTLVVSTEEIEELLLKMGFTVSMREVWQTILTRTQEQYTETIFLTKCGFSLAHQNLELRNLLLNPDGTISLGSPTTSMTLNVLREIYARDEDSLASKIEEFFPPLQQNK